MTVPIAVPIQRPDRDKLDPRASSAYSACQSTPRELSIQPLAGARSMAQRELTAFAQDHQKINHKALTAHQRPCRAHAVEHRIRRGANSDAGRMITDSLWIAGGDCRSNRGPWR